MSTRVNDLKVTSENDMSKILLINDFYWLCSKDKEKSLFIWIRVSKEWKEWEAIWLKEVLSELGFSYSYLDHIEMYGDN